MVDAANETLAQPRRAPRRARAKALALGLGGTLALVVALEFVLRAAGFGASAPLQLTSSADAAPGVLQFAAEHRDPRTGLVRADPERGYALRARYRSTGWHAGAYALDQWPWRGRPAEPAPPDMVRVVVLGDSCVYGVGIETSETLAEQLALELERRGLDRTRVQVLNLGVPGYSTVQIERVLDWALRELRPAAAVFYVAAWNDGTPSTGRSDAEILVQRSRGNFVSRSAIVSALRSLLGRGAAASQSAGASEAGAPGNETVAPVAARIEVPRVAADEIEPRVRAMVERARSAGCAPIVVSPAHPAATERDLARVVPDRESVRRGAFATGAPLVDAEAVALASGLIDEELFVDFVHPSIELWRRVAPAVAEHVATAVGELGPPREPALWIRRVEPRAFSSFGDAEIALAIEGWSPEEALPVATVGGAALLDIAVGDDGVLSMTLPTNAAGHHDLLVQTERGVTLQRDAVELVPTRLERCVGGVVVVGRAGDRAKVFVSSRAIDGAQHTPMGVVRIDYTKLVAAPFDVSLDASGRGTVLLPTELVELGGELFAQALAIPRGEHEGSQEARVTAMLRL